VTFPANEVSNSFNFSIRSRESLRSVHPDLARVAERALELTTVDFILTEGKRTLAKQREYIRSGASRTLRSRHIPAMNESGFAEALDIMPLEAGKVRDDLCPVVAKAFYKAAAELGVDLQWGGDWRFGWKDTNHFELKRS
jgi:peptidoglycan L-alanyl-D-glutamate endopeptidase CwlK